MKRPVHGLLRALGWGTVLLGTACGYPAPGPAPQEADPGGPAPVCELAILTEKTWDEFVPKGKEVDAIYGDIVLRNDRIVAVIANPVSSRRANMTIGQAGGCIVDLTERQEQSDQLDIYSPDQRRYPYRLESFAARGKVQVNGTVPENPEAVTCTADQGRPPEGVSVLRGDEVEVRLVAAPTSARPQARLEYTLRGGSPTIEVRTHYRNAGDRPQQVALADDFRADRTFTTEEPGETPLVWFYDRWWNQGYGVMAPEAAMRLSGSSPGPRVIQFLIGGQSTVTLEPGGTLQFLRQVFPGAHLIALKATAARLRSPNEKLAGHEIRVRDRYGPVAGAEVEVRVNGQPYGSARSGPEGVLRFELPPGPVEARVTALGHEPFTWKGPGPLRKDVMMDAPPRVVARISSEEGGPIPCKVQFIGAEGTPDPNFFDASNEYATGENTVRNLHYSPNGRFTQVLPPGTYEVIASHGPEYDAARARLVVKAGQDVPLEATLRRVVESPGWVSADFHSHSSHSGDTAASPRGRVLNLVCEHIEFAPCTEHNRLETYMPYLRELGLERAMGTCTGIELTGMSAAVNHQNAFPLQRKPHTQDNGGPPTHRDPAQQIRGLALWDNASDKLVQVNHPDIGEMFFDRNGDGTPDGGHAGMFAYIDVLEVHPIEDILGFQPHRGVHHPNEKTGVMETHQHNHTIFNWIQLLNQGRRLPGVVNSDAHYNFHGSGFIRNYVKCRTDDPSRIDPMDIVRAVEKGHVVMTNGPYLEVALADADGPLPGAIPGDDLPLPGGRATLHVRVQCPNWLDVDRVQVLLNGRPEKTLNWTRSANPGAFSDGTVKFDRRIPLEFKEDTHLIVVAAGEKSHLGPVLGPAHGGRRPTAVSNPIFVDADGHGFQHNGDMLGAPLPVKGGKKAP